MRVCGGWGAGSNHLSAASCTSADLQNSHAAHGRRLLCSKHTWDVPFFNMQAAFYFPTQTLN